MAEWIEDRGGRTVGVMSGCMRVVRGGEERTVGGGRRARGEREAELQRNDIPIPITFNGKERKKKKKR